MDSGGVNLERTARELHAIGELLAAAQEGNSQLLERQDRLRIAAERRESERVIEAAAARAASARRTLLTVAAAALVAAAIVLMAAVLVVVRNRDDARAQELARIEAEDRAARSQTNADRQSCYADLISNYDKKFGIAIATSQAHPQDGAAPRDQTVIDALAGIADATALLDRRYELCGGEHPDPRPARGR